MKTKSQPSSAYLVMIRNLWCQWGNELAPEDRAEWMPIVDKRVRECDALIREAAVDPFDGALMPLTAEARSPFVVGTGV